MNPIDPKQPADRILAIRGLRIEANGQDGWSEIIHGIDLDLRPGEVLGLIGESGAGKSTIGLAAMGYTRRGIRISGGEIVFDGQDLAAIDETGRRRIRGCRAAYVAQSAATTFNPAHRLIEQCIEIPVVTEKQSRKAATEIVEDLFARLRLPDPKQIGQRFPHQLSGGQLQRAMTAMAMAPGPKLIVFDEPTTALDVTTQVEVLISVRDAVRRLGLAALYISHDLAVVAQIADRIMVLRNGALVEQGTAQDILYRPQQDYTRRLVAQRRFSHQSAIVGDEPAIRMERVQARYGALMVLRDVTLAARRGETLAIVGESGSGKTTAARALTGLIEPAAGKVFLGTGELPPSYRARSHDQLRRIQFIHQSPDSALNPEHSVREILGRILKFHFGIRRAAAAQRIRQLLEMIELDPDRVLDRKPGELSGGQKQRICIARALAAEPEVIVCDEITSALDPLVAEELLKLLSRLQREQGLTYLFITHDMSTVRAIADRIVVMKGGEIVEEGSKEDVFDHPRHPYTRLLLRTTPEMDTGWLDRLSQEQAEAARVAG